MCSTTQPLPQLLPPPHLPATSTTTATVSASTAVADSRRGCSGYSVGWDCSSGDCGLRVCAEMLRRAAAVVITTIVQATATMSAQNLAAFDTHWVHLGTSSAATGIVIDCRNWFLGHNAAESYSY